MLKRTAIVAALGGLLCAGAYAQEAEFGITVPVTLSFGAMDTHRFQIIDPKFGSATPAFRAMMYPTLKLGSHWFLYAALQVRKIPYFYYDAFLRGRDVEFDVPQAYIGYAAQAGKASMVFKAGQLVSAFGSFPLHYDDMQNPVIDQPLSYITRITMRTDQLSCGTSELLRQKYGFVFANCGGAKGGAPGLTPVTLYGLLGAQAEISVSRFDARFQLTNSSPAYATWGLTRQFLQWAAGGGFTIRQGFRIGASAFRGPYLQTNIAADLPRGTTVRDFPATGLGIDGQWARGRVSLNGEYQRLQFNAPNFEIAPAISSGYLESKVRLTPRFFLAGRAGWLSTLHVKDSKGISADQFAPLLTNYELATGAWLNRHAVLKVSYSWLHSAGTPGTRTNVVGFQLVANFRPVQWAFR